jgi:hypothetical protein
LSSGSDDDPTFINGTSATYGTEAEQQSRDTHVTSSDDHGMPGSDADSRQKHAWWKRERKLQRSPSLDKVDEDELEHERKEQKPRQGSMSKLFGVKSYLHNFYEGNLAKDPTVYEDDDDFEYLLGGQRRRRCTSIWWKVFVWIGANFLIFGIIGVLVGYLVPQKPIFIGKLTDHVYLEDRTALAYNYNLDVCKLVGLILFCIGGLTLAVALLFPSFLYHYCEDDRKDSAFKVKLGGEMSATSPLEMQIPASSLIAGVQPERRVKEAIITKEGMLPYKD